MLRDITLGQYYQADSVIHKLDPRVKLIATIIFIISLFLVQNMAGNIQSFPDAGRGSCFRLETHHYERGVKERCVYGDQTDLSDHRIFRNDFDDYAEQLNGWHGKADGTFKDL